MTDDQLAALVAGLSDDQLAEVAELVPAASLPLLTEAAAAVAALPTSPLAQAVDRDRHYRPRPHLRLLSDLLVDAVADVEAGIDRRLIVSMPPRAGKSTLVSEELPVWLLRRHPDWSIVLASHESTYATSWGRRVRRRLESDATVTLAADAGAAASWETTEGGGMLARGVRSALTGYGAKVMVIDDPVKDYADAHSADARQSLWDWWLTVAQTRLEAPTLVVVVMTRWHEDDFVGRLTATDTEGDPDDWTVVTIPAVAEVDDPIGRAPGEPLLSPLLDESVEEAAARWARTRRDVGAYTWASLYQQAPAPPSGRVFDIGWWRFWTSDPDVADRTGARLIDAEVLARADGVTAWDAAFKDTDDADYVVGQAWVRHGADYVLVDQHRDRMSFTATLDAVRAMRTRHPSITSTIIEDKANGPAIIDVMRAEGVTPVKAEVGKVARARSVTPLAEAGRVWLPHPEQARWAGVLLDELRDFPGAAHDDQVDALVHALRWLDHRGKASVQSPARQRQPRGRTKQTAARVPR